MKSSSKRVIWFIVGVLIIFSITFIPLPYYITKPGLAEELEPIVKVEGGYKEDGSLMLTTVRIGKATPLSYVLAQFQDFSHLYKEEEILGENESNEEYNTRQLHMMEMSQESAIAIAYEKADKDIEYKYDGVYVMAVAPDMPADGILKTGDVVTKVDNKLVKRSEDLISYVEGKKAGDKVSVTFKRNGKVKTKTITLEQLKVLNNRVGMGISLVTDFDISVDPKVKINSEEIGGPSAGLMFSLEIYNQLTKDDLTKGRQIAGTGTINEKGEVGEIGGIEQKIVAADKAGAEIFFAPNNHGAKNSNYQNALKAAKQIDTDMKVVPVDTFDDAVSYLNKMPEKE